ncbi:MAG: S10 family peptidase [Cyanophyceae cyanobacterium]
MATQEQATSEDTSSSESSTPSSTPEAAKSAGADANKGGNKTGEKKRQLLGIEPMAISHELAIGEKTLHYESCAGSMPLKDEFGEVEAEIFFTAYTLKDQPAESRPLVFAFNGGPGSASVWLHLGALGPKKVVMEPEGWQPSPPFRLEDNPHTWLDRADLVFIDPVGTGYSRAVSEEKDKKFWSYQGDLESVGEFIRLYLTRYERWSSPLYLAGESYGTTRAAGLAGHLVERGINFNGIILISSALDLRAVFFLRSDDLPFPLFVPTYAASAWYHQKLESELQGRSLKEFLAEVEAWSERELTFALMQGSRLSEGDREATAATLARYTGLDKEFVLGSDLRINISRFCKELFRPEKRNIGRFDSRYKGIETLTVTEYPEFDPTFYAIQSPFTSTFNDYARRHLGIKTDLHYEVLSFKVNSTWQWENGELPTTTAELRDGIAKNPFMKVLVAQGYYDLATPHFATDYMISHMNLDASLRENVRTTYYEAGHMFYLDQSCLTAFKADIDQFWEDSWQR